MYGNRILIGAMIIMTIATSSICPAAEQETMESIVAETHDNLEKYLDYLGQQSDDGTFDGLDELLKNNEVYIMYMGGVIRIPHTFTTKEIEQIRWISNDEQNEYGLTIFKRMFTEYMGFDAVEMPIDDLSDECYVWFDIDNYRYVVCWLADNDRINVLWMVGDDDLEGLAAWRTNSKAEGNQRENITSGMENALGKANTYLKHLAFSYSGLYEQLQSDGFTDDEARYGVDNCGADWKEQAKRKAETYLKHLSFSKSGLIEQLEYDGFTKEQAEYGVEEVY